MANDDSSRPASTSSTRPCAQASGTRLSNKAGMPRKRRRQITTKSPKKRKKQQQQPSSDDNWCEIKGILGEREVNGQIHYLVEWEDHPTTGEVYPFEWKIEADLSKESIVQWDNTKRRQETGGPKSTNGLCQPSEADDSQEARPACYQRRSSLPLGKRPRAKPTPESVTGDEDSEASRSRKQVRLSSEQSEGPASSFTTSTLSSASSEQPDSPSALAQTCCQVIIDRKPDFDPSEYHSVQVSQSTAQHISSQSVSALESQDQNIILSAGHSQGTIPDSQEPSSLETRQSRSSGNGSSPYLVIPDSLPLIVASQAVLSEGSRQELGSIPSHQPEHGFYSHSRIEMSTPRDSHGLPPFEGSASRGEGSTSNSSHPPNAFLTQPAQQTEGSELVSTPGQFSDRLAREKAMILQRKAELSSSSGDEEDDEEDEGNEKESIEHKEAYPEAEPVVDASGIEPAQPRAEIPVLPSVDLSGTLMPALQSSTDIQPFRPSSPLTLTLPLLANRRSQYIRTIEDLHRVIDSWRVSFIDFLDGKRSSEDEESGAIIDTMFHRLQDLCDYGGCEPSEEPESLKDRVNWWSSANSKFNFLHELLKGLAEDPLSSTKMFKVAIVVDMEYLLPRLCEMSEFLGVAYTCKSLDRSYSGNSSVHVTLVQTGEHVDVWAMDVVIAYGTGFNKSDLAKDLQVDAQVDAQGRTRPLVLQLAIAMSIEHVENELFQLDRGFDRSEHRYALLWSIIHHMEAIRDPPGFMDVEDEPQRLAGELCRYLLGDADFSDIAITPWPLETSVEELLDNSQLSQKEPEAGRKRPRAGTEIEAEEAKRLRRDSRPDGPPRSIPLPRDLRKFLEESGWKGAITGDAPHITIPLTVLQDIRARLLESKRVAEAHVEEIALQKEIIESAGSRDEDQAFYDRTSEELRRALSDRSAAEEAAKAAEQSFAKKELVFAKEKEKLEAKIRTLEDDNSRLRSSTATVDSEKLLKEAQEKLKRAESRLDTAQSTEAYMREQYHKMSSDVGERRDLEAQIEGLQKQADKRTLEIQKINNGETSEALLSRIAHLETTEQFSNMELARLHEENRQLKNNRRETRQGSTPRSPRPGLMSPRPRGQLSSREASPVMGGMFPAMNNGGGTGMQYTSQNGPGGARWGHGQVP